MALMPVDEALARVLSAGKTLGVEIVKLDDVIGRVLAKDVKSKRDQPPFQSSAMDGYAVRHADLIDPLKLLLRGMVLGAALKKVRRFGF
jgi:molybdopterin molybdotransferase